MADHGMKRVLVLCTGNSCRSIMAEAVINHDCPGWRAVSAGSHPTGRVHPMAMACLADRGIPAGHAESKSWDRFAGQPFDRILTVCNNAAGEACPVFAGPAERLHWPLPDPARATGTTDNRMAVFQGVLDTIIEQTRDSFQ